MNQLTFGELKVILLDFIDNPDGFLYLRMVGEESSIGAVWAKLSGKEGRGKKWSAEIKLDDSGVVQQRGVTYRTLKTRLSNGLIDMVLIHPILTIAEDRASSFYILTYEDGVPSSFFDRLNKNLTIPLKAEWVEWLWIEGLKHHSRFTIEKKSTWDNGMYVDKDHLTEVTETPIHRLISTGNINCYSVNCSYKETWLKIIRDKLNLNIILKQKQENVYVDTIYSIAPLQHEYALWNKDHLMLKAESINWVLTHANKEFGLPFILEN